MNVFLYYKELKASVKTVKMLAQYTKTLFELGLNIKRKSNCHIFPTFILVCLFFACLEACIQ